MKKLTALLTMVLAALLSNPAMAVVVSEDGSGEALIFPFYAANSTASGGIETLISVVNDSQQAKALRLRLHESLVGHPVVSMNIYLGPHDTWTAALTHPAPSNPGGAPRLITADESCAVPAETEYRFDRTALGSDDPSTTGMHRLDNGYIEVFELGVLTDDAADATWRNQDCDLFTQRWTDNGAWTNDPGFELQPPTGGLSGNAWLVDVGSGQAYGYRATAIKRFSDQILHSSPTAAMPDWTSASAPAPDNSGRTLSTVITDDGPLTMYWDSPLEAVSAALTRSQYSGDQIYDVALAAASELIISSPVKRHMVAPAYANGASVPIAPFVAAQEVVGAPVRIAVQGTDRQGKRLGNCFSAPVPVSAADVRGAVGIFTNNGTRSAITGSVPPILLYGSDSRSGRLVSTGKIVLSLGQVRDVGGTCSWSYQPLSTNQAVTENGDTIRLLGAPYIGLVLQRASNGTRTGVGGAPVLANYGIAQPTRTAVTYEVISGNK